MAFMFKLLAGGSFIGNKNEKRERRKMTYIIGITFLQCTTDVLKIKAKIF